MIVRRRTPMRPVIALFALLVIGSWALVGCGADDLSTVGSGDPTATADQPAPSGDDSPPTDGSGIDGSGTDEPASTGTGTIAVQLEDVEGYFIEGFEVGLRFETADGQVIASTLWTDAVDAQGDPDIDAFYDAVVDQAVPAGEVVVRATVNVGMGPPPEIPDLAGDLDCELTVDVADGTTVGVEVALTGDVACLRSL